MTTHPDGAAPMSSPSASEIERARAAVSVACLRWLRAEAGPVRPPRPEPDGREDRPVRLLELPDEPGPRGHPLWDRWLDG